MFLAEMDCYCQTVSLLYLRKAIASEETFEDNPQLLLSPDVERQSSHLLPTIKHSNFTSRRQETGTSLRHFMPS